MTHFPWGQGLGSTHSLISAKKQNLYRLLQGVPCSWSLRVPLRDRGAKRKRDNPSARRGIQLRMKDNRQQEASPSHCPRGPMAKPSLHSQRYEPGVLMHRCPGQAEGCSHSSRSATQKETSPEALLLHSWLQEMCCSTCPPQDPHPTTTKKCSAYARVHEHERAQGRENGETLGGWQPGARRPPLTLTALLALRDNQGVARVAEAQIGAHAVDTATFPSTRILQALVFICAQAGKEGRLSAPAAPAAPHQPHSTPCGQSSAQKPEILPQEPVGPKGLQTVGREALLFNLP